MEVYFNGMFLVIICELEYVEFYCEILWSYGLFSIIELDEQVLIFF